MKASPAKILRSILIDLDLVTMPGTGPRPPSSLKNDPRVWCFTNSMPDDYDRAVAIYDTGGKDSGKKMRGDREVKPTVTLIFRSLSDDDGREFALAIVTALADVLETSTIVPDLEETHTVHAVMITAPVTYLGQEMGNKRHTWSAHARITFSGTPVLA